MKKVIIIAGISKFDPIYSIANVVRSQCKYLIQNNYKVKLLVWENFESTSIPKYLEKVEISSVLEPPVYGAEWEISDKLETRVDNILNLIKDEISESDICIAHDFLLLHGYVPFNLAFRKLSSLSNSPVWLHWNHSRPIYEVFDEKVLQYINSHELVNSFIVYPNRSDKTHVCDFFSITEDRFLTVHNNLDLDIYLDLPTSVIKILTKFKRNHDFISLYPTRLNLHKSIDKLILLTNYLVQKSINPLFIVANSYNFGQAAGLKEYYKAIIKTQGIEDNFVFTSDFGYEHGLPNIDIQKLFQFSSFFIFPTKVEAMPLVLLEAAVGNNILVVNDNVDSLKEVCSTEAYYVNFSDTKNNWMNACLQIVKKELKSNKQLRMKNRILKKFTTNFVYQEMFENELEKILNK